MFTVRGEADSTSWSLGQFDPKVGAFVKYPVEFEAAGGSANCSRARRTGGRRPGTIPSSSRAFPSRSSTSARTSRNRRRSMGSGVVSSPPTVGRCSWIRRRGRCTRARRRRRATSSGSTSPAPRPSSPRWRRRSPASPCTRIRSAGRSCSTWPQPRGRSGRLRRAAARPRPSHGAGDGPRGVPRGDRGTGELVPARLSCSPPAETAGSERAADRVGPENGLRSRGQRQQFHGYSLAAGTSALAVSGRSTRTAFFSSVTTLAGTAGT